MSTTLIQTKRKDGVLLYGPHSNKDVNIVLTPRHQAHAVPESVHKREERAIEATIEASWEGSVEEVKRFITRWTGQDILYKGPDHFTHGPYMSLKDASPVNADLDIVDVDDDDVSQLITLYQATKISANIGVTKKLYESYKQKLKQWRERKRNTHPILWTGHVVVDYMCLQPHLPEKLQVNIHIIVPERQTTTQQVWESKAMAKSRYNVSWPPRLHETMDAALNAVYWNITSLRNVQSNYYGGSLIDTVASLHIPHCRRNHLNDTTGYAVYDDFTVNDPVKHDPSDDEDIADAMFRNGEYKAYRSARLNITA